MIDTTYEGSVYRHRAGFYEIEIERDFHVYDRYDWHGIGEDNLTADFELPWFGTVTVPDEWAARIRNARLGAEFDMYADWSIWNVLIVRNDMWQTPTVAETVRIDR